MRAGTLDRVITIERATNSVDDYGTPGEAWITIATMRAALIQSSVEEFIRAYGTTSDSVAIFRTRFLDGVSTADRVTYEGAAFDVLEVKEIGRRKGLELRCTRRGA